MMHTTMIILFAGSHCIFVCVYNLNISVKNKDNGNGSQKHGGVSKHRDDKRHNNDKAGMPGGGGNSNTVSKRKRENKKWTDDEKARLRDYVNRGYKIKEISKRLERTDHAVRFRMCVMDLSFGAPRDQRLKETKHSTSHGHRYSHSTSHSRSRRHSRSVSRSPPRKHRR